MSKEIDKPLDIQIASALLHLKEMNDPEFVKQHEFSFARAGIYNVRTIADLKNDVLNLAKEGIIPPPLNYWSMERFNPGHPMTVKRFIRTIPERTGHYRKTKYFYKSATIKDMCAPLGLTAHAVSRFRERGGYFMPEKDVWNRLPELLNSIFRKDGKLFFRTDILLPYGDGAFAGFTTHDFGFTTTTKWSRKHGIASCENTDQGQGFIAYTWIARDDMMKFQRDILDAYQEGDAQAAMEIQKDNINHNQLTELKEAV